MPELPDLDQEALASTTNLETLNGVEEALDIIQLRIETARQNFEFFKALPESKRPQISDGLNTSFNNRLHEYAVRNISLLRKRRVHAEKDAVLFKMLQNAAADSLDELCRHNGVTITDPEARAEAQSSKTGKIKNVVALQSAIKRHFIDTLLELGRPQSELSEVALGRPDGTAVELLPILFKESLISKTTGSAEEILRTLRKQQNLQDIFKENEKILHTRRNQS